MLKLLLVCWLPIHPWRRRHCAVPRANALSRIVNRDLGFVIRRYMPSLYFLLALLSTHVHLPAAQLDDLVLRALDPCHIGLRWDNVEGPPQWVCGSKPTYDHHLKLHLVYLQPGDSVTFKVPPRAMVRVLSPMQEIGPDDVELWTSNGTGLYRRQLNGFSPCDTSLIAVPDQSHTGLARVVLPSSCRCALALAIFTSRLEVPEVVGAYRHELQGCGPKIVLREVGQKGEEHFYCLQPGSPAQIAVTGPTRLEIETRLRYPAAESRILQTYQVAAYGDGGLLKVLEYQASSESQKRVTVDDREEVLGSQETAYLDVPPGDYQISLDATANLLVRITSTAGRNYLFPKFNQPNWLASAPFQGPLPRNWASIWDLPSDQIHDLISNNPQAVTAHHFIALRSARDNRYRAGGLRSMMLMRGAAVRRPEYRKIRTVADEVRSLHTVFRDLLPTTTVDDCSQRVGWFYTNRLRDFSQPLPSLVLAEQHIGDALGSLSKAYFLTIPSSRETAHRFRLPVDLGTSLLRVCVDRGSLRTSARIMVQYDDHEAVQLVAVSASELPKSEYLPSRAEAALTALSWQHFAHDAGTLGGPFSTDRDPADLLTVATNEFIVPSGVGEIRVWAETPGTENVALALQYRASRRYRLGESQYLELVRRSASEHQAFVTALDDEMATRPVSFARQELHNHWHPFVLFLRTHQRHFTSGVQRNTQNSAVTEPLTEAQRQRQYDEAVRLTENGSWLPALEAWSKLLPHLTGAPRRKALLARVNALAELPEAFLAERELRALYLLEPDAGVQQAAFDRLLQFHRRRGNLSAEERLLAAEVMRQPTDEGLAELAEVLVENGRYEFALMAALAVTEPRRPVAVIVRAAFQMRWWQVFQDAIWHLPGSQQTDYWLAQRQLVLGNYAAALDHFAQAGQLGTKMASHFRSGQQVHAMLRNSDVATRALGVLAWEQWQARHPGPQTWHEDGSLVKSYSGAAAVYRINRDSYAQTYKARPDRPVLLSVLGPIRLKLEARPIRQRGDETPINDMLYVRAPGREYLFPINNNYASQGLRIVGDPNHVPGGAVTAELDLGPGLHEIEVTANKIDLLVRAFVQRPETPLPVLPPLDHDVVNAVLTGHFGAMIEQGPPLVHLLPFRDGSVDLPLLSQTAGCERCANQIFDGMDSLLAGRLALRTGQLLEPHAATLLEWASSFDRDSHREKMLALAQLRQMQQLQESLATNTWKIPVAEQQAVYAATGDYKAALDVVYDDDPDALLQHLAILIQLAELDDDEKLRGAVLGSQLAERFPNVPGLAASTSRLTRYGTWTLFREIIASDGLHGKSIEGWQPETPSLRVRKALLSNKRRSDNILSGYQHLVLAMQNPQPTVLELSLSLGQLASLRTSDHVVEWQLDDRPANRILLKSGDGAQSLRVEVPQGLHRIRLWLAQPLANQYVLVSARENPSTGQPITGSEGTQLVRQTERLYHVATQAEPVRFRIDGPAQVRIDELDGEVTVCRYLTVSEGTKIFDLRPSDGVDIALLRIFEYRLDATKEVPPAAIETVQPEPLPEPLIGRPMPTTLVDSTLPEPVLVAPQIEVEEISPGTASTEFRLSDITVPWRESLASLSLLSPDAPPESVGLFDTLPLGNQEDGTWSLGLGFVSRRALDEGANGGSPGRFMEWNATYRSSDQINSNYQKTELLFRLREQSGPTVGLRHASWYESDHLPFNVAWKGFAYAQRPGDARPPAESRTEWSFGLSGQLWQRYDLSPNWYHVPSVSAFGRLLTQDSQGYQPGRIDQDIFTQYKADHQTGMRLWDTFAFTPWLDAKWWFRPGLVTNENFDFTRPEQTYVRIGRSQMIGALTFDISYRIAKFHRDENRSRDSTQHLLALQALVDHINVANRRCEFEIAVGHDLSSGKTSASISLAGYFDNGRRYRDIFSGEARFLSLRKQHAAQRLAQRPRYTNW